VVNKLNDRTVVKGNVIADFEQFDRLSRYKKLLRVEHLDKFGNIIQNGFLAILLLLSLF